MSTIHYLIISLLWYPPLAPQITGEPTAFGAEMLKASIRHWVQSAAGTAAVFTAVMPSGDANVKV